MDPAPFLRGNAWPAAGRVPYPRAKPDDRLPRDTWSMACIPAGVRLELAGEGVVDIAYRCDEDDAGYRSDRGRLFEVWRGGALVDEATAVQGEGSVRLRSGTVHLPEWMKPTVLSLAVVEGAVEPGPAGPRWLAYGDSVAEGWVASSPGLAWPAAAARLYELDVVNMGYAGAARGEVVSAEHLAELDADVISITHGTNCWTRTPHSTEQMAANTRAFLDVVRRGHPDTPIVVASPIVRPDAESTPNPLGATLADLRGAMEEVVQARIDDGDKDLRLLSGLAIVDEDQLADGIHPGDDGHRALAQVVGGAVAAAIAR